MSDQEIAKRIVAAADQKQGSIFVGDVVQGDINLALERRWLVSVGIGHYQLTDAISKAAR